MNITVLKVTNSLSKIFQFIILFFFFSFYSYSQSNSKNYNLVVNPKIPLTVTQFETGNFNTNTDVLENVNYSDGFDRIVQSILKKQNPDLKDLVQLHDYDEFGKESKRYFSFFANQSNSNFVIDVVNAQKNYYQNKFNDATPFSQIIFDGSPLNRVKEISKGGDTWKIIPNSNSKTEKFLPGTNLTNEVRLLTIDGQGRIVNSGFYQPQNLLSSTVRNENWILSGNTEDNLINSIRVFSDKNGKKIAETKYIKEGTTVKRLVTQYVYDDKGLLAYILTPKANTEILKSNYITNGTINWNYSLFLQNNVAGGGSDVTANITNGILTIKFSAGFNTTPLKTGPIVYISDQIANTDLGVFSCTSCTSNNYRIYIENGYLCIGIISYPVSTTGFTGTYTANVGNNITLLSTQEVLDKYAYQYKYDNYNRKIEQKTPGKGWEYNVFDQLDRPILTQDTNLRSQNLWQFIKYDINDRVAYTGKYQSSLSRNDLQIQLDNFINSNTSNLSNIEERSTSLSLGGTTINYTNNAFPKTDITEVVSVSYYDDYSFTDVDKPVSPTLINGQNVTSNTQSLLTANFRKTVDGSSWTKNYIYYDENAKPIYNFEKNFLGGYTKIETTFDFRGKITKTVTKHKKDNNQVNDLLVNDRYEYDYAERLVGEYQSINSQPEEAIVKNIYDELGNLKQKKVGGSSNASNPLQLVSYTYNIRGWLTKINDPNTLGNNLFGLEIKRENSPLGSSYSLYNGNVSQVQWKTAITNSGLKTYNYQFDKLNQLTDAEFSNNNVHNSSFLENINYDENGNILSLKRSGNTSLNSNLYNMDNLVYSYDGNQIKKIDESGSVTEGYKSIGGTLNTYEYDSNGNLIKDRDRGIDNISYNYLNLIQVITFSNGKKIKFNYDASGSKLSKEFINGGSTTTTNYLGGFQYINGNLQFFPTSEGYAVSSGSTFKYAYVYSDHQGNNRLSYCDVDGNNIVDSSEIQSATDYYPYGMSHSGEFTNSLTSAYLYKMQGKEFNNEENLGYYDYGSRMYDPAIGRWMSPDPKNQFGSPYVALGNNPILLTDPNGEWAGWDDVAAMVIGGTINLASNAIQGNVKTWGDGFVYFGTGALAGEATLYGGPEAGAAVLAIGNDVYGQYRNNGNSFKNYDVGQTLTATGMSVVTAGFGSAVGGYFTGSYSYLFNNVTNPIFRDYLIQSAASASTGFVVGTGASYLSGNTLEASLKQGGQAAATNFLTSSVQFGVGKVQAAYKNKEILKQEKLTAAQKEFQELEAKINLESLNKVPENAAQGVTIGLGLDDELVYFRRTGVITYKEAGWQKAGLTRVDWGRATDNFYFKQSFEDATKNASMIKFNVTNFNRSYIPPKMTNYEFEYIIKNPVLFEKTIFINNGSRVYWNGSEFTK